MPNSVWPTTIQAYTEYYKRFNKTYHVLLQLESVAQQGKSIPRVAALVEAMFMAELENQLLTAGHDLSACDLSAKAQAGAQAGLAAVESLVHPGINPSVVLMAKGWYHRRCV